LVLVTLILIVVTACNSTHTVNIIYQSNGGNLISSTKINSESPQWHPALPTRTSYLFVNWYIDESLSTLYTGDVLKNSKSLTLYAKWIESNQEDYVIINFDTGGGTFIPRQLILKGSTATMPQTPKQGTLIFSGWFYYDLDEGIDKSFDFSTQIFEHMTIYAHFS
jgi:uncharacterized repeat protein (TIGR02543 family)